MGGYIYKKLQFCFLAVLVLLSINLSAQSDLKTGICISFDGKMMVYTSAASGKDLFYQSTKNAMWQWDEGIPINSLNQYIDSTIVAVKDPFLTYDGQCLLFSTKTVSSDNFDIYYSVLKNGEWQKPLVISSLINTENDEESPSLTADNNYFYFTRKLVSKKQVKDDEVCRTIYRSVLNSKGEWEEPKEVKISVFGCEAYPLIFPDGKTLLFSSSKLPQKKKNKYDIYYVNKVDTDIWSQPISLDSLITEADEISSAIDYQSRTIYVLQVKQFKKENVTNIASMNFPSNITIPSYTNFKGKVFDFDSKKGIDSEISIANPITKHISKQIQTDNLGNFIVLLENGKDYRFNFDSKNYSQLFRLYDFSKTQFNYYFNDSIPLYKTVKLKLNIYDKYAFNALNPTIKIYNELSNMLLNIKINEQTISGQFYLELPVGEKYKIKISHKHYHDYIFSFDLTNLVLYHEYDEDISLSPDKILFNFNVVDLVNKNPIDANIDIINTNIDEYLNVNKLSPGIYTASLREGNDYSIYITKKGYAFYNEKLNVEKKRITAPTIVKLIPLIGTINIELKATNFEPNATNLMTESYNELDYLVNLLLDNPELKIEIGVGFVDNKADPLYCERLTTQQASKIIDYLIMQGIIKDRVTMKGYGKQVPKSIQLTNKLNYVWYTVTKPAKDWEGLILPTIVSGDNTMSKKDHNKKQQK